MPMNNIHTIRIKADAADTNDPRDCQSGEGVKIRRNDDCNLEVTFFNRGEMLDMSDIVSATLEILEIGQRNSAAPRETKVALRKTLSASELNASLDAEDFESGLAHAKFAFGSADTSIPAGEKWLKIYLISDDGRKTTFSSGWIDFLENYGENAEDPEDIGYPALLTQSAAEAIFAKKSSNLADLADATTARSNIGAAADSEVLKKADNLLSVQNPATARNNIGAASDADVLKKNSNLADVADTATARSNIGAAADSEVLKKSDNLLSVQNPATARNNIGAAAASEFNAALLRTKNIGTFEISYGDGLALARPLERLPLSVCFRIKISSQSVGDIYAGQDGLGAASNAGFCLYKDSASTSKLAARLAPSGSAYTASFADSTLADGNWHSVAVVLNSNGKAFIDGELVATTSNFDSSISRFDSPGRFYFGKSLGGRFELSGIKAFNFDMSASGAPYDVAKCAAGEEPRPALSRSAIFGDKNYGIYFRTSANSAYDAAANVLALFQAAGVVATQSSLQFNVDFPVPIAAGKTVKITYDSITGDAVQNSNGAYAYISFRNSSDQYPLGDVQLTSLSGGTILKTQVADYSSYKLDIVRVYAYTTASSETDQNIKINGLRIEVDGELLNLSDTANAYQARDISANGNHATLLGGAKAGKSAVLAQMGGRHYWGEEVSTGAYMLADSHVLPANSQVEILAKAQTAATLEMGSGASAPSEYATAASVGTQLSSVVTFYTGAVPTKLFVTPSIAGLKLEYVIKISEV
ncbi:MAG: hypothetical protein DBX55_02775 [Verrucomicrobia bacterium]|nr:MAG: hypothetical protein DBX55_02775 [Verrucomicrobiota bacterium]